ncbi:MAG: hypothetical protein JSV84_17755 [Gemmatimonadota bacterium]|nr:MAG: hypothetical protein JSV84_17755 [Gemmatimonadota bacterium]
MKLLKIGARVLELRTKVKIHLPSSFPFKQEFSNIWCSCCLPGYPESRNCMTLPTLHFPFGIVGYACLNLFLLDLFSFLDTPFDGNQTAYANKIVQ